MFRIWFSRNAIRSCSAALTVDDTHTAILLETLINFCQNFEAGTRVQNNNIVSMMVIQNAYRVNQIFFCKSPNVNSTHRVLFFESFSYLCMKRCLLRPLLEAVDAAEQIWKRFWHLMLFMTHKCQVISILSSKVFIFSHFWQWTQSQQFGCTRYN